MFSKWKGEAPLEDFWNGALSANDPQLHGHPMLWRPSWKSKALPIAVDGDAARFSRRNNIEVCVWGPLLAEGSTWSTKLVCAAFVKTCLASA
eukprot:8158374-Alexandrium_andersonii.AAC.1